MLNRVFTQVMVTSLGQIINKFLSALTLIILTHLLTPYDYGTLTLVLSIVFFIDKLLDTGIKSAIVKVSFDVKDNNVFFTGFVVDSLLTLGGFAVCLVLAFPLADSMAKPIGTLIILAALFLVPSSFDTFTARLQSERKMNLLSALNVFYTVLVLVFSTVFLYLKMGLVGVIFGYVLAKVVWSGCLIVFAGVRGKVDFTIFRRLMNFTTFSAISNLSSVAYTYLSIIFLGYFVSNQELGSFSLARSFGDLMLMIPMSYSTVVYPLVSSAHSNNDYQKIRTVFGTATLTVALYGIAGTIFSVAFAKPLIELLFGAEYIEFGAVNVLRIYILAAALSCWCDIGRTVVNGLGRPDISARINLVSCAAALVFLVASTAFLGLGIYGAAFSSVILYAIFTVWLYYDLGKLVGPGVKLGLKWWEIE